MIQYGSKIPETASKLQDEYKQHHDRGTISQSYEEWRNDYVEQVAVAWVIACIFVRFIEDNELINEGYIAGEGERGKRAEGEYTLYFRAPENSYKTDREYLKNVFEQIGKLPAAAEIFDRDKNPLWQIDLSGDAARHVLKFFQELIPETGALKRSFTTRKTSISPLVDMYQDLSPQARFLGDLYQDLSEHAQKKYALKQTPEFIQQFILNRALEQAINEFGLKNLRLIDPACGSGHFLLGAFDRLFEEWTSPKYFGECNENVIVAAQNAFDSIHGVDINPFAIAITRFRLFVAAVQSCKINRLNQQTQSWKFNIAVGDSLLRGSRPDGLGKGRIRIYQKQLTFAFDEEPLFPFEEAKAANEILDKGYHVVVGNPPYITVKDKAQNEQYRKHFRQVCHRQYSLGVPFTQRFWELAVVKGESTNANGQGGSVAAGFVGIITANSFMKREFGKKLIEEFLPKIDLTHVIDTSGAYIPGHGTPTVILFGRNQKPVSKTVRAVLGIKGEPRTPDDPANGLVWQSIQTNIDLSKGQDPFTSSTDVNRDMFANHPWSIGGGGATDIKELIENGKGCLAEFVELIGYICMTRADDIYFTDRSTLKRVGFSDPNIIVNVEGDTVRDWSISNPETTIFPYKADLTPIDELSSSPVIRFLWPFRSLLWTRREPNGDHRQLGLTWYEWSRFQKERYRNPIAIAFAFVATHNHFVLDRGGKVFKQSAPIIKLPADATEDNHLGLLGLLNTSTACFWMKQTFHNKGDSTDQQGARTTGEPEFNTFEFTGTGLQKFPIPASRPLELAKQLDRYAVGLADLRPEVILSNWESGEPLAEQLELSRHVEHELRSNMIAQQEELDWKCYELYGLIDGDEVAAVLHSNPPAIEPGQRAFEIVLARRIQSGESDSAWFRRHGFKSMTEMPDAWPTDYRSVVEKRIQLIESNSSIRLIEDGMFKRRWHSELWEVQEQRALKNWLLERLESSRYRNRRTDHAEFTTTAQMSDVASADAEFMQVATLYRARPDFDLAALIADLVEAESVPFLPVLRYKITGLRKREVWERTWDLQRQEDLGQAMGAIAVPPKYVSVDFLKTDFWRLRGKLDVPKERWVSYPHCSTESDPSLVVLWAGCNHLQQATALIEYYDARKREGWDAQRLAPLLAGLDQLLPWIHQWHPEIDPEFGETAGKSFHTLLEHDAHELGLTIEDIRNWTPPAKESKASTKQPRKPRTTKKKIESVEDEATVTD